MFLESFCQGRVGQRRSGSSIYSEEPENRHRPNHISTAGRGWQGDAERDRGVSGAKQRL